ncbi:hypothetical protein [Paraburkholderia rhynchosiae]|uniref:hypothetical protein n=1 Tax=Paraburkholderia rhynchosiae TaxID=487049 RepID=UPI00130484D1|nr:hypothetical protein [Paraburkholderia rhynchosiae]
MTGVEAVVEPELVGALAAEGLVGEMLLEGAELGLGLATGDDEGPALVAEPFSVLPPPPPHAVNMETVKATPIKSARGNWSLSII